MPSWPQAMVTPAARNLAMGGTGKLYTAAVTRLTPASASCRASRSWGGLVGLRQAVRVADRDAAAESGRPGPFDDQLELPGAERSAVMQVDVDPGAVPFRQREHHVQMPDRIAIGSGRVDPADHLDAVPQSLVEQFGGARIGEHAVLREGHLLDGDPAAETLPGRPHRPHPGQPVVGDHVGVRADVSGARCHHLLQQRGHVLDVRQPQLGTPAALLSDAVR